MAYTKSKSAKRGADKQLRRTHDQFKSNHTQQAINDAILAIPGTTIFDQERITEQLGDRLREFKHTKGFKAFRTEAIAWVTRQAHLTVALRQLMQESNPFNATLLFTVLPSYEGSVNDSDALREWAVSMTKLEADARSTSVPAWVSQYRKLIYSGIWHELQKCLDLGVGGYDLPRPGSQLRHQVVEEIASDVWLWVYKNAFDLVVSKVPMQIRLWRKARRTALLWKLARIQNRNEFVSQTTLDLQRARLEALMQIEDKAVLSASECRLLERAEGVDINDTAELYSTLFDEETGGHSTVPMCPDVQGHFFRLHLAAAA